MIIRKLTIMAILASMVFCGVGQAQTGVQPQSLSAAFKQGTPSGQIRSGYISLDPDESNVNSSYDLALGGQLKFVTAPLYGISLGAAFYTSHSLTQPDEEDYNDELSSSEQHYDLLAEAYITYAVDGFTITAGRQLLDTPFVDSDDCRMTPHTFEALVASYAINDILIKGGYLSAWQGVDAGYPDDADFDDLVEDSDGTFMLGATYSNDTIEANAWFYVIDDVVDLFYVDAVAPINFNDNMSLTLGVQVSAQNDSTGSNTYVAMGSKVEGELYGAMAEFAIAGVTIGAAYDHAEIDAGEALFGGFGGGPFFTNIDTLVANEFAAGQDADSYTLCIGYDFGATGIDGLSIGYTYGNYQGGTDPMDKTADAEVDEHDFYVEYVINDSWSVDAVYVVSDDKEHSATTDWDYQRAQVRVNLSF